ncbi:YihY/virulence factor BrkB family protein [Clostridium sediminicola]|uniref:YihY/virulence factor BrkB family protein n=1 Tax=Clostridium sediminicola TaxID=3114879 RepID=UPI0031F240B0
MKYITFLKQLVRKLDNDDILALSSQLAYGLLLSFFPFLIFLLTILGYIPLDSSEVLHGLKAILPQNAYELITTTIVEIFDSKNGDLLSFSLIITIWTASTGLGAVRRGLNKAYNVDEKRSFIEVKLASIISTFGLSFMIIFAFFLLVIGNIIGLKLTLWLRLSVRFNLFWNLMRYFLALVSMILIFAVIYKVTPTTKLDFEDVFPGAVFATLGWLISSLFFSYYVDNFSNYSRIYGGIATVVVLMIWLYISSLVILIGGEINSIISKR